MIRDPTKIWCFFPNSIAWLQRTQTGLIGGSRMIKETTIGVGGLGFDSHCNATLWFSATLSDGITVNVMQAETYQNAQLH